MKQQESITTYRVEYQPRKEYDGDFNVPIAPGVHGSYISRRDAEEGARSCKRWFNEEKSLLTYQGPDGKMAEKVTIAVHDNVVVAIVTIKDGVEDEKEWDENKPAEKGKQKKPELATA